MEIFAIELFEAYGNKIILFHVLCAFFWFTGMIATRLFLEDTLKKIKNLELKLGKRISITQIFFLIISPFILGLLLSLLIMFFRMGEHINLYLKLLLWCFIVGNFFTMYKQLFDARRAYREEDFFEAQFILGSMSHRSLPMGILIEFLILVLLMLLWIGMDIHFLNF